MANNNHPCIGAGPGNVTQINEKRKYQCGGTIPAGRPVAFIDATAVAALVSGDTAPGYLDGNVVDLSDLDAANPTLGYTIGVSAEAGTAGGWIDVIVAGIIDVAMLTDGSVEEGDVLIPTATAGTVGGTAGETQDLYGFAIALADDSSTAQLVNTAVMMKRI